MDRTSRSINLHSSVTQAATRKEPCTISSLMYVCPFGWSVGWRGRGEGGLIYGEGEEDEEDEERQTDRQIDRSIDR